VFYWADGKPIDFNTLQTAPPASERLSNPAGTLGSPLAGAPQFQGNVRVRYEWTAGSYQAFAQMGAVHQSHSLSSTDVLSRDMQGNSIAYDLPAFTTYDAALGLGQGPWLAQAYGQNLSDTRAQLFANYSEGYKAVTVNRPRTIGLRVTYNFGGL
jgi:iron complex outermembrane recepter protein